MSRVKLVISYDGTDFHGFQIQAKGRTIEGELRKSLSRMHKTDIFFDSAGRTDSGVHANGQVISFQSDLIKLPKEKFLRAVNNFFPADIKARSIDYVDDDFHARKDARTRVYKYYVYPSEFASVVNRAFALRIARRPSIKKLNEFARAFIGTYDFTTFSAANEQIPDHRRTINAASWYYEGPYLVFQVSGISFLWRMVRSLVGSMLDFEELGYSYQEIRDRLLAKDRFLAGPTASPVGLFLHEVVYKNEPLLF